MAMLRLAASILLALVMATPLAVSAQPATKVFRVGYLGSDPPPYTYFEAFRAGLRRLGYVQGQNIIVEGRHADGRADRLAALASELSSLKLDVIVPAGVPAAQAARKASGPTLLVVGVSGDPVESGFVASLARPGGNITGMSDLQPELAGKRLQLLREIAPKVSRVAMLVNPNHAGENQEWREMDGAAKTLGMTLQYHHIPPPGELTESFAAIAREPAKATCLE